MSQESRKWAVVNTHPHKERFALENLSRQEFETYCPMLQIRVRHARKTSLVLRPMFPGYLFAAVDGEGQRWRPLMSTFGVRTVVRSGDCFSLLPQEFVDALRVREIDGAIVRPTSPYRIGQTVKLVKGPFDGLIATIIAMDERDRLMVLMDFLNRPVKVQVETSQVAELPAA
jgi:transcriptional antiterminator RfaH